MSVLNSGFFQSARAVVAASILGFVGDVHRTPDFHSVTATNAAPQARAVKTVVVDTATNAAVYTVTIDGIAVTYTADGSATKPEISAGLKAAIDAEPGHRVSVVDDGVDKITITANWPGVDFTLTAGALLTAAVVTAADQADPLYPGRIVIRTGEISADGVAPVKHPVAADFTAQTSVITITTGAAASFVAVVKVNGTTYTTDVVPHTTDATGTAAAIIAQINATVPANTVLAANALGVITLTAEVAGLEFEAEIRASGVAGNAEVTGGTGLTSATSLSRKLYGLAVRRLDVEADDTTGEAYLPALGGVEVIQHGRMVVARTASETWLMGQGLYVGVEASTAGKLYNTAAAGRVYIGASPVAIHQSADSDLGVVAVSMGA